MFVYLRTSSQGCGYHINLMYRLANPYCVCFTCIPVNKCHQVMHVNQCTELAQWGVALWRMCCYYCINALLLSFKKSRTSILPSTEQ